MKAAIYARVSVKHKNRKDMTIQAQIQACRQALEKKGVKEEEVLFCDTGYSGKSMDRPAFLELLRMIQNRNVQVLAVKDFSRLGRNYREVGEFVEKVLPCCRVRLVTVTEHFDSAEGRSVTAAGLFHLLNEWYLHDLSKKVSSVKKEKKRMGNYMGSTAPYGYRIVLKNGIRILEKDPSYQVVQKICALSDKGYSSEEIVRKLYKERINPPKCYDQSQKLYFEAGEEKHWQGGTIRNLLRREK